MKIFKSISCLCLVVGLLVFMTGCPSTSITGNPEPRGLVNFAYFDTVSYVYTYAADSDEAFEKNAKEVFEILSYYHQLFDIYHEYSGITNLCTINKNAGGEAMEVDSELIDFLLYAKRLYGITGGEMNVMMGSVLKIWHDARTAGTYVPDMDKLTAAKALTDISLLEIDEENNTVRIAKAGASLDVGALGKGYATEKAAEHLENEGVTSYVLNIGGNIRIIGTKPDGSGWKTGITNPHDKNTYANYINISDISCVTSGDYERNYTVDGVKYHHIIDKDTLMPSDYFSSVTILTKNSGLADALSTALFSMSYEDGLLLLEKIEEEVEVLWIEKDGTQLMTEGFTKYIAK